MAEIIDVSYACPGHAGALVAAGVGTIVRYYSRDTGLPTKRLSRAEARAFAAAGLRLAAVHEARRGDLIGSFTRELGYSDAAYCHPYAATVIEQPAGTAIYFAVDLDPSEAEIAGRVVPYFEGVAKALADAGPSPYRAGVYGSGAACAAVLDKGLASFAWLAQSTGWRDYKAFRDSNRWALRQLRATRIGEVDCDPNVANGDFGDFSVAASVEGPAGDWLTVIAKDGLRLRAGPGTDFDVVRLLPFRAKVAPLKVVGDWTQVDVNGEGGADGFVSSHFLQT